MAFLLSPKGVLQSLNHIRRVLRLHLPKGYRPGKSAGMGIRDVKIIQEPLAAPARVFKDRDPVGTPVHPSSKAPVPILDPQNRRRIRFLGIDQQLLVETQPVVPPRGAQETHPRLRLRHVSCLFGIESGNKVKFLRYGGHLLSFLNAEKRGLTGLFPNVCIILAENL